MTLSDDAIVELAGYAWPGNVRELKHVIDYLAAAHAETTLDASHVRARLGTATGVASGAAPAAPPPMHKPATLRDEVAELEKRRIAEALEAHGGHQANAAAAVGMPLRTFVAKLKRYALRRS
jgi:DNA-binding NtrC family response regulator